MAKYILSIISVLLLIGFVSCDDEKKATNGQGYLYLGIEKNITLQTKAVDPVLSVAILNAAEDTVKYIADFEAEKADEGILLDAGSYQVVVASGKKDSAAWELPNFYGKTECDIKTNQVTSAKVTCKIANTKVTVDYSDDFKKYFTDYSTTVSNISGSLTFVKGETRGGYFAPETLLALLKLTNTDGEQFELKREYADIQERYHYKLYFKLSGDPETPDDSGEAGGKFDDITIDERADTVIVSIPIKVEDLENIKAPELKLEGFGENNSLEAKEGEFADNILKAVASCGIEKLLVTIQSDSLNNRVGIQSFDLASLDAATREKLESIHFPVQSVKSETDTLTFDLTAMSNALKSFDESIQTHNFTITITDAKTQEQSISFSYSVKPNVAVITKEIATMNIWSTFTFFSGESDSDEGFGFEYKKVSDSEWTPVTVASKNKDGKTFSAFVKGLEPKTRYVYRAISNDQDGSKIIGNDVEFTTDYENEDNEGKPFVPNLGFDKWYKDGKSWYANESSSIFFWDSGNGGANTITEQNPTSPTDNVAVSENDKRAALLETKAVVGVMAAGNIYTGKFVKAQISFSNPGALLDFGQKYEGGRPTKLTGYYRYKSVTIDNAKEPYSNWKGKPDSCSIYIALCDWTAPFRVDTQNKKFVNLNGPDIIAYGELSPEESGNGNMQAYEQFEIDIKYRDLTRKPTYILIVASASKYGDYFTGGEGSTLYIDEFELQYDYNPASFVGTSLEGLAE
ncbi:MAG: DUF4493 domain-containing protein [Parabacteroides johnsonii]|nr:DUF4493 domain-containing protein [Parabacteroides johnsonii]